MRLALQRLFFNLFPMPRRALRPSAVLSLALFLILFAGGAALVEWRGWLRFSNPAAFWLSAALPWLWWMHVAGAGGGLNGVRAAVALWVRWLLAGALIFLLAEPRAVRTSDALTVVYALDISDSMGQRVSDQALNFITSTAATKPEKDEAGLVVFGREAAVELPPRTHFPLEALHSQVAHDATNLEKGLSLAAAMLPESNPGRIVLISDGDQTEGSAAGPLLDQLKARGIAVDVLPIQFDFQNEVWLERLNLPRSVKQGETYEASVVLSSLKKGSGKLSLRENGRTIFEKEVEFEAGKNRFTLPLYLREPGYYEYAAVIDLPPGQDGRKENNIALNDLFLKGEGTVLLVTDPQGDARDRQALVESLRRGQRIVEERPAYDFPRDAVALLPYDSVIFDNVPADAFDLPQLQAVRDAAYNQGVGFLMVGGANSFGPGGYHRSPVEEALPVDMDIKNKKVLPKASLAIVLHTCEFAEGNTWAKRIAKESIRVLGAQDDVGIMDYEGSGMQWIFPLRPAGDYEKLVPLINQAEPGDMPSFQPAMQMGFDALQANDAAAKHLIVISDGDPSPPTPALVSSFSDKKITMSVVIINPHGGSDISIMQSVVAATGGRYYAPSDASKLPSIFIKEAKTLKRNMIQNKTFTPAVTFPSPILKGLDALPPVHGYTLTNPKDRANTILKGPETQETDPVLAIWRFGLSTAAAWTSDLSPNWGADWLRWEKFDAFVKQLITEVSRVERKTDLRLRAEAEGSSGVISAEDFAKDEAFLDLQARVTGPGNRNETVQLRQIGPHRYQGYFPLWGKGRYQVLASGEGGGRNEQAFGGFAVAYSSEYLRFRSDPILLKEIAARTGARVLTGNETGRELFTPDRQPRESTQSVIDWFLIVAACLVPLDVAVRRVQLDWGAARDWLLRRREPSPVGGETVGSLLRRKQEGRRSAGPSSTVSAPRFAPTTSQKPPTSSASPSPAAGDDLPQSTAERLLARKRRREKNEPPPNP
jgi:uncharacterized membrane protein/Mg-chelatase subunit ChlD